MRKLICIISVALIGYVGVGLVCCSYLSKKVERDRKGITVAIAAVKSDQVMVSERLHAIIGRTLDAGHLRIDETREMLSDPELNRIAISYTGSDWSGKRREFLSNVAQVRKFNSERLKKERELREERLTLEKTVKELENRKRGLSHQLKAPRLADDRRRHVAAAEIDCQLNELRRRLNLLRMSSTKDDQNEDGDIRKLDALTAKCQNETIEVLRREMSDRLEKLLSEGGRISGAQAVLRIFDIWPVNLLVETPKGDDNGVQ